MTPRKNIENASFIFGQVNLGEKKEGDKYLCKMEIEVKGVRSSKKSFGCYAQGSVDGNWSVDNIWNVDLLSWACAPSDGIYQLSTTQVIDSSMEKASNFSIGVRCDNWDEGSFRVRNISIEKIGE